MHKLEITPGIRQEAEKLTREFIAQRGSTGNSANGIGMENETIYGGFVGELCFKDYLEFMGKDFTYHAMHPGVPDAGDFDLVINGQTMHTDVKTATKPNHVMLMVPDTQYARKRYDMYIGLKINGDMCEIWGWCKAEDLGLWHVNIPTRLRPLDNLVSIESLLEQIDDKI